jgi:hypothetical protein
MRRSASQAAIAAALRDPAIPLPDAIAVPFGASRDGRFAVHRNNVTAGLIAALEERFPVISQLVGAAFFRAMAKRYVELDPPRSPVMLRYGDGFPSFIGVFPPAAALPYLPDVARLEYARGVAYHAADDRPLAAKAFAALRSDDVARTCVRLHPSVTIIASRFPIVSIWEAHAETFHATIEWSPETALVARPASRVELTRLPPGVGAFFAALQSGRSLAAAATEAALEVPAFDPATALSLLIESRVVTELALLRNQ